MNQPGTTLPNRSASDQPVVTLLASTLGIQSHEEDIGASEGNQGQDGIGCMQEILDQHNDTIDDPNLHNSILMQSNDQQIGGFAIKIIS